MIFQRGSGSGTTRHQHRPVGRVRFGTKNRAAHPSEAPQQPEQGGEPKRAEFDEDLQVVVVSVPLQRAGQFRRSEHGRHYGRETQ